MVYARQYSYKSAPLHKGSLITAKTYVVNDSSFFLFGTLRKEKY